MARELPYDCDVKSFEHATELAKELTEKHGRIVLPVDHGSYTHPQFGVVFAPRENEPVSYAFNGDSTPCGIITQISGSYRRVVATDEQGGKHIFYRRKQTGAWIKNGTWSLVKGHVHERNPSF